MNKTSSDQIHTSVNRIKEVVMKHGNPKDIEYFNYHELRFIRMAEGICERVAKGATILDVGSHYLHSSMILSDLGFKVIASDVKEFYEIDFIRRRREHFQIEGLVENNLESFESLKDFENRFDAVLFTEILEHITFNPIEMWRTLYNACKTGALIYISTPNSLSLPNLLRAFKDIVFLKGLGIKIDEIMTKVTYGHHWKEFTASEIKKYFRYLSDDFKVDTRLYKFQRKESGGGLGLQVWQSLMVIGSWLYFFSPTIEAFVRVEKSNQGVKVQSPSYK